MLSYYLRNKDKVRAYQAEYYRSLDYTTRRNKIINYEQANKDYIMAKRKHYYNTIKMKKKETEAERIKIINATRQPAEFTITF